MLEVSRTDYGVKLVCSGDVGVEEMASDVDRAVESVRGRPAGVSVLADVRELTLIEEEAAGEMKRLMAACEANGCDRVAALVSTDLLKLQLERLSRESRGEEAMRLYDARELDDPERTAESWVRGGP